MFRIFQFVPKNVCALLRLMISAQWFDPGKRFFSAERPLVFLRPIPPGSLVNFRNSHFHVRSKSSEEEANRISSWILTTSGPLAERFRPTDTGQHTGGGFGTDPCGLSRFVQSFG
jgi:hypothetical protein